MELVVNEKCINAEEGTTLSILKKRHYPEADLIIVNGFPVQEGHPIKEGDRVVFIRKGIVPENGELEALMVARHSPYVFGRMKKAVVGIAGVGGLGSTVAIALARMGVGCLILADGDVVEPSNLNRQQYFIDQIGLMKVDALKDTLSRVNRFCKVDTHQAYLTAESVPLVFNGADVVVEAFDRAGEKAMLIDTVMKKMTRTIVIGASGLAGYDSSNTIKTQRVAERLYMVGDLNAEAAEGRGLMAPRVGIAASHQANAVVRFLMDEDPAG